MFGLRFFENKGVFGVEPCSGSEIATVKLTEATEFSNLDFRALDLCDACAESIKLSAEEAGYEIEIF